MKLIAICGQKGTGKDLVSNLIVDTLTKQNVPARKLQFGDAVKKIIQAAFALRDDREYNQFIRGFLHLPNGRDRTGKEVMKVIQARLRQYNNKVFIEDVEDHMLEFKGYHPEQWNDVVFVITDLRYKEELKWCRANSATIIKVEREGGVFDPLAEQPEIDDFFVHHIIDNNGTEAELNEQIKKLLPKIVDI